MAASFEIAAREERNAARRVQRKVVVGMVGEIAHDDLPDSAAAVHW